MQSLRWFTKGLRKVYARFTQVYARFTQSFRRVYAEFTWKAFPQPMCVNLRKASLRKVYAEFTQGQLQVADDSEISTPDIMIMIEACSFDIEEASLSKFFW